MAGLLYWSTSDCTDVPNGNCIAPDVHSILRNTISKQIKGSKTDDCSVLNCEVFSFVFYCLTVNNDDDATPKSHIPN